MPESLHFCFQIAAQDTPLYQADLHIEEIPVVAKCADCHVEWTVLEPVFKCGQCSSGSVEIISGRELDIISIEVVNKDSDRCRLICIKSSDITTTKISESLAILMPAMVLSRSPGNGVPGKSRSSAGYWTLMMLSLSRIATCLLKKVFLSSTS